MTTNLTGVQREIRDMFLQGVYNDTFEVDYNGGPKCASESTFTFKCWMIARLIPWYIFGSYMLIKFIKGHSKRKARYIDPSIMERIMGIICFICFGIQIYTKTRTKTLIFLLNPCHVFTIVWGIVLNMKHSLKAELVFLFVMSNVCGPAIGMVFAENDELDSNLEIISYWVQHSIAAFFAPLICLIGGRFAHSVYSNPFYILVGYQIFTVYMRFFLTPLSALTWANLNHSL